MSDHRAERAGRRRADESLGAVRDGAPAEEKWVYLRTVYPLNPGIAHYLDFPGERG